MAIERQYPTKSHTRSSLGPSRGKGFSGFLTIRSKCPWYGYLHWPAPERRPLFLSTWTHAGSPASGIDAMRGTRTLPHSSTTWGLPQRGWRPFAAQSQSGVGLCIARTLFGEFRVTKPARKTSLINRNAVVRDPCARRCGREGL